MPNSPSPDQPLTVSSTKSVDIENYRASPKHPMLEQPLAKVQPVHVPEPAQIDTIKEPTKLVAEEPARTKPTNSLFDSPMVSPSQDVQAAVSMDPFKCTVSWVVSIDEIYLLPRNRIQEFEDILVEVQDHGSSSVVLEVGMLCVNNIDGVMFRARIEKVSPDKKKLKLFYIDIGRRETVLASEVRQILHHKTTPGLVVKVGLSGIKPGDGDTWSKESISVLEQLADIDGETEFLVTPTSKDGDRIAVDICDLGGLDMKQSLVELGFAVLINPTGKDQIAGE